MNKHWDFAGWATRNDLQCSDGRVIKRDAFKHQDGEKVPLCFGHVHDNPNRVLGYAILNNRPEGVYTYCYFNASEAGKTGKELVVHGDIESLSIFANRLIQKGHDVVHGSIKEVSLVLAGANPGAYIDDVTFAHSDDGEYDAFIYTGENIELYHEDSDENNAKENDKQMEGEKKNEKNTEKTVQDVLDTFSEDQMNVLYYILGEALGKVNQNDKNTVKHEEEDFNDMHTNVFDANTTNKDTISHSDLMAAVADGKKCGSMKEAFLQHGIENVEYLFPEVRDLNTPPEFIKRDTDWVSGFMNGATHTPFSRIRSRFADITGDEARARGYLKGKLKKEEMFSLLKRTTEPTTIYKKQKMDRDDVVDITDFDVVSWLKSEMRGQLDEEIAVAALISDGRLASDDDHIDTTHIRPIAYDDALYTVYETVSVPTGATGSQKASAFIDSCVRARKNYKGSGNPTLYTTEDTLTECLLLKDFNGHRIYATADDVAKACRVSKIETVEPMENKLGKNSLPLMGIIVNPKDYTFGADKGGAVNMFDDFDIDYNQQKYLIETRCSGALTKPYSAISLELEESDD